MKKILITGGNSGIGKQAALQLAQEGHDVTIIGRDPEKGKKTVTEAQNGKLKFISADLSTIQGIKKFSQEYIKKNKSLDVLIHCAGVLMMRDQRTSDDLHEVFAVNYFSRFLLTELLTPILKKSKDPRVIILVAGVSLKSQINFEQFPKLKPFPGMRSLSQVQIANYHYAHWFAQQKNKIQIAVVSAGLVKTDIMRAMPFMMKTLFTILSPIMTISPAKSASNLVSLSLGDKWENAIYLPKPGKPETRTILSFNPTLSEKVVKSSKKLAGLK